MSSPDLLPHAGRGALLRVVRLAARSFRVDASQFVPSDGSEAVAFGDPRPLTQLGLDVLVKDRQGLFVPDTVGTPPFSRLAPEVRFFAAVPVLSAQKKRYGALCVFGDQPRAVDAEERQTLAEFGLLAASVLDDAATPPRAPSSFPDGHGALVLLVDPRSGEVVEANETFAAYCGSDSQGVEGRTLGDLGVLSVDRTLATLQQALSEARSSLRIRVQAPSSDILTAEFATGVVLRDGRMLVHAVGRDVTEQVEGTERLRRSERMLRGFYDGATAMMGIAELIDDDFRVIECNDAAARFFTTTPEAMAGCPAEELGMPDEIRVQWVEGFRQSALSGGEVRFTYDHPHARGRRRLDVGIRCIGLAAEGVPQFAFHVEDRTERAEAEAAVRAVRVRADSGARLSGDLLASLAHEVRTPLATLVGFSRALDAAIGTEHRDLSGLVVRSGHRLLGTIDSMIELAGDDDTVQLGPVDVAAETAAAARLLRPLAARKGLKLDVRATAVPPALADARLISRVVHNLISDAIAFTESGGVGAVVTEGRGGVLLRVCDTGEGVNEAFLPQRTGSEASEGLALTKRLVERLGGTLDVTSGRGEGTTFTVWLSLADEAEAAPTDQPETDAAGVETGG